jgi:hypothetical protein
MAGFFHEGAGGWSTWAEAVQVRPGLRGHRAQIGSEQGGDTSRAATQAGQWPKRVLLDTSRAMA